MCVCEYEREKKEGEGGLRIIFALLFVTMLQLSVLHLFWLFYSSPVST